MSIRSSISRKNILTQAWICLALILANFVAQVPYFFHLYARTQDLATDIRSFLIMGAVFVVFLAGAILLFKGRRSGFWLLGIFLSAEFLFYLSNTVRSVLRGYALFFQVFNPDLTLRIIYSIGYLNLFASGYFLFLLLRNPDAFAI